MFPIELSPPKSHCDELHKELQEILKLFIQENLNFEDKNDFIDWIDGFLPDIKWQEYSKLSADLSIYFLCRFSLDARWEMHFVDFLKKWLLEHKEAISLNYQQNYFHLKDFPEVPLFISKVQIHVNNPDSLNTLKLHLLHLSKKIRTGPSCSTSFPITSLSSPDKIATVHENVKRMIHRFPHYIEPQALQELSHLLLIAGEEFVIPRTPKHVTRLTLSQHHIRKKLLKATFLYPNTRHIQIRFIAASLLSPFSSKQVLGVMLAVNLFEKYESLDEQQIILTAKKFIPEIEGVKGATYSDLNYRERIKILYVECKKSDDSSFSLLEKSILKQGLQEELKYRIEKLAPTIFMVRNEEEVLRTILILNQEIKSLSDIPQVVISFDRQVNGELIFTVILLSIRKLQAPSLTKKIDKIRKVSSFFPYRIQVVRYLEEKHPIEAHVFSIPIKKEPSLLREDSSFNFYLAREKVSQIVTGAVGEFRDYNGGIIIKQKEALSQFKNLFKEFAENKKELLENFFYSLVPLEAQVTLPLASLQKFFSLFLKELSQSFAAPYSYFLNFEEEHNKTYLIISFQEESLKELVGNSLEQMNLASRNLISAFVTYQETFFLAYIFENTNKNKHEQFIEIIKKAIDTWQEKIKNLKSLKLSFQSSLLSLDPRIGGDEDSRIILKLLFEGLMRVDKKGKISNGIAQSFHISKDLRSYRFKLRESVWSNGDPLTAYDFEYAWKKTLSPNFNTPFAYLFFPIKNAKEVKEGVLPIEELGVHALNDKTLEVELSHVAPYFLELTTHTIFSPIHRKTDQDHPFWPTQTGIDYLCNGAFTLKINSQSHGYEVIKNPLYWDYEEVKIDQIIITRNSNSFKSYELFKKSEIDWIGHPGGYWDHFFTSQKEEEQISFAYHSIYWCVFNTKCFPFHLRKLRKALALAINRADLIKAISYPATAAFTPIPLQHAQRSDTDLMTYQLKKARQLFNEALNELGLDRKTFPPLHFIYTQGTIREISAHFIKNQWEKAFDIQCHIEAREWKAVFSRMVNGDFQIGGMNWSSWIDDPIYTLGAFQYANDPINFSKWESSEYQSLLNLSKEESIPSRRLSYLAQAEELLLFEMPVIPLYHFNVQSMKKKHVLIDTLPLAWRFDFKWLDIAKKIP